MSLFAKLGIPDQFVLLLITFGFILLLAPYFSGFDFGIFKIPEFSPQTKARLRILGPVFFLLFLGLNIPLISEGNLSNSCLESPSKTKMEVTVNEPPSNVRNEPNGNILCEVKQVTTIDTFGKCSPNSDWYYTDICSGTMGLIHSTQIKEFQ